MAIIIEDGSGNNPAANSYATRAQMIEYAALRGQTVVDDATADVALHKAMDYLEAQKWMGEKVRADQPLSFPRWDLWVDNFDLLSTEIPRQLIYGQIALALEALTTDLQPNLSDKGSVTEETVSGAVTVRYAASNPARTTSFSKAQAIIQPLLRRGGLFVVRA